MELPLRNLTESEKAVVKNGPVWVGILIGCVDGEVHEDEVNRIEEIIKVKSYSENNDVRYIYKDLAEGDIPGSIASGLAELSGSVEDMFAQASDHLSALNTILPKLDDTYAKQYRASLQEMAVAVAKAAGGVFGLGSISAEEKSLVDLPMINEI